MRDLYDKYFHSAVFICDHCKKEYVIDLNHQKKNNNYWLSICVGIEMERIPELYKDNEIAQKIYLKRSSKK